MKSPPCSQFSLSKVIFGGKAQAQGHPGKKKRSLLHADFLVILFHGYMLTRLLLHADAAALEAFCVLIFFSVLPPPLFSRKKLSHIHEKTHVLLQHL